MSLTDLDVKSVTAGTGALLIFGINFDYQDATEVAVYTVKDDIETLQEQDSDYSISGTDVVMESAPPSGTDLVIIRETPLNQPSDFKNSGPITLENFEKRLDVLTQMSQELSEKMDRGFRLPRNSALSGLIIPTPEADKVLGWDTAATGLENKSLALTGAAASSQAEAEAGTNNTKFQTPLRTKQTFDAFIDTAKRKVTAKSANFTAGDNEDVFMLDSSGGIFTVSLPTATGRSGKRYTFRKIGSDFNIITIDPFGSEKIELLSSTVKLRTPNDSMTVICDGVGWHIIERKVSEDLGELATTISWTAGVGTKSIRYIRDGVMLKIIGSIPITGAVTAANLTLTLPNSWTMLGGLYNSDIGIPVGRAQYLDSGVAVYGGNIIPISTTQLQFDYLSRDAATELIEAFVVTQAAPITWGNVDSIFFEIEIPMNDWSG